MRSVSGMPGRIILPLLIAAVMSGCAGTSTKRETAASPAVKPALYSQLSYWPVYDRSISDGEVCLPESWQRQTATEPGPLDLWQQVVDGYAFEDGVDERRVKAQLSIYKGNQALFDTVGERASNYMHFVVEKLEERDMPLELALLPIVESAYNPTAVSSASAVGMWQFIPGTGKRYGLEQNYWYDARKDVIASTDAALDYLQDLHERFNGDWYLALAAYNAGEGRVERAISYNQRKGLPTDYWSLKLPRETLNYVPRLIAVSRVLEKPERYGLSLNSIPLDTPYAEIELDKPVNLLGALDQAGLDKDQFYTLNPAFRTAYSPPKTSCTVLVPVDYKDDFKAVLDAMPAASSPAVADRYRIQRGDSLGAIARRHKVSVAELQALNGLKGHLIRAGDTLVIPPGHGLAQRDEPHSRSESTPRTYTVRPGDNLWSIARRERLTTTALVALNRLDPAKPLKIGQTLIMPSQPEQQRGRDTSPGVAATDALRKIEYRVVKGDSIHSISRRFGVSTQKVLSWNGLSAARPLIKPGQTVVIYVDPKHEALQVASAEE